MRNLKIGLTVMMGAALLTAPVAAQSPGPQADPLYQAKGDHNRSYFFAEAGKTSTYRVYVPSRWTPASKMPLVVILHGANLDENSAFERAPAAQKGLLTQLAEDRGYIIVAVNGLGGAYGNTFYLPKPRPSATPAPPPPPRPPGPPPKPRAAEIALKDRDPLFKTDPRLMIETAVPVLNGQSEQDVLNVVARTVNEYNVDRSRIYLMGNSMGSMGTWHLASKYPEAWRAIVPSDGPTEPTEYPFAHLKAKAVLIIGGDKDPIANPEIMKALQAGIQAQGIDARYYNVPGGTHPTAWYMALTRIFDFYDEVGKP